MYIFQLNSPGSLKTHCTRDCSKLAGNGSGHCNQQFDLMSLDNVSDDVSDDDSNVDGDWLGCLGSKTMGKACRA